jgi:hypothetical protein
MAIELSNLTFTEQDDIVPAFGVEEILNTGIANTIAGNDRIIGVSAAGSGSSTFNSGIYNTGTLNTGNGNDILEGHSNGNRSGINNSGNLNTGNGNDIITGTAYNSTGEYVFGFITSGSFYTGDGDDIITSVGSIGLWHDGQYDRSTGSFNQFDTGEGNDIIIGVGSDMGIFNSGSVILTRGGNDIIIGSGGSVGIDNQKEYAGGDIYTGEGNDIIIGSGQIGIRMSGGRIDTAEGDDIIIANGGFGGYGFVDLGYGNDYLKGFGKGFYFGTGNYYQPPPDQDTLELTSGSYTVSRTNVEYMGTAVNFTKDGINMTTFQFEKLIAGSTTYDFSSLTEGQTIVVA